MSPRARRPIGRWIAAVAVVLLGVIAAGRLPLAYLPDWSFPELSIDLQLPEPGDVESLTRTWIVPLESAIRAAGGIRGLAGRVHHHGGSFRVRFDAGTDPERKTARLESEVATLRRRLPPGASLAIRPIGQREGDLALVAFLAGSRSSDADLRLVEVIRDLPRVRDAHLAGDRPREIRIVQRDPAADPADLRTALRTELASTHLGHTTQAGRRWPVWVRGAGHVPFAEQLIRQGRGAVPLAAVAAVEMTTEEAHWSAHYQGRQGSVLLVERELDASPINLSRDVQRVLDDFGIGDEAHIVVDEATPLRSLLKRSLLGLAVASLVLAIAGGLTVGRRAILAYASVMPVATAVALEGIWLAGLSLDVTTVPAIAIALACGLLFLTTKHRGATAAIFTTLAAGLTVPIAIALTSGHLAPLLAAPARAFTVTLVATAAALWLLPLPPPAARPAAVIRQPLKSVLRHPATVILILVTASYLLIVFSGRSLSLRPGRLSPALADLAISLDFPPATTMPRATAQISAIEAHLSGLDEVAEHWSSFDRSGGSIGVRLQRPHQRLDRLRALVRRIESALATLGAAARVVPLGSSGRREAEPIRFSGDIEDLPETDEGATTYRFLLRSTDLAAVKTMQARARDRLEKFNERRRSHFLRTEWGEPSRRVELVPRPEASPEILERARDAIRRLALPRSRSLADERQLSLRVTQPDAPRDSDEVPQKHRFLGLLPAAGDPLSVRAAYTVRETDGSPSVARQSGRWVVPMTVRVPGVSVGTRKWWREQIDHQLGLLPVPSGVDLVRPELNPHKWGRERWRMLAVVGALPVLLLAVAACRLDSLPAAALTLTPLAFGALAASPWILATKGHVDEMTMVALAAVLAGSLPWCLTVAADIGRHRGSPLSAGFTFRWLARRTPAAMIAALAATALLMVPGVGLDNDRAPWVLPQRAAAITLMMVVMGGASFLPILRLTIDRWRRRDPERQRRRRQPPAWHTGDELELSVRHLTKVYGNGFRALHDVHFDLGPGITGLLGPNGAGKTTLIRLLCGLLESTRGQVRFHGVPITPENLPEYRRLVGFLPQGFNAYEGFTAERFLDYWAIEKGLHDRRQRQREIETLLVQVGLEEAAGRKVRDLSGGMRRRIGIARALLGDPRIVIVDEPTTGLDIESRNRLRRSLLAVAGERIILFSTHIASDIAAAAGRILVLDGGRLLYDGSASGLIELARGRVFETIVADQELGNLSSLYQVTTRVRTLDGIRVRAVTRGDQEPAGELVDPNLEEAYLAIIARQAEGSVSRRQGSLLDLDVWRS